MDVEAEPEEEKKQLEDESNAEFQTERTSKNMIINNSNLSLASQRKDNTFEEHVLSTIEYHKKVKNCNDINCKFHHGKHGSESDSENEGIHNDQNEEDFQKKQTMQELQPPHLKSRLKNAKSLDEAESKIHTVPSSKPQPQPFLTAT